MLKALIFIGASISTGVCIAEVPIGYSGFYSACHLESGGKYYPEGGELILSYSVGEDTSVLYLLNNGELSDFAWLNHGLNGTDEFFDAQGGVLLIIKAGEAFAYLEKQPFKALPDGVSLAQDVMSASVPECNIDFSRSDMFMEKFGG